MRRIPIARLSLFTDRRRAALGLGGVVLALLIVLALDAIFAGSMRRSTRYIDTAEADVFVSQSGVRNMHMSTSSIPLASAAEVARMAEVESVAAILYETSVVRADGNRQISYLIGYRVGEAGGPTSITSGKPPSKGEIVLDERAAAALGVGIGDSVGALGRGWRVSGLTGGMTNIASTVSYVRFTDFATARSLPATASFLLVSAPTDPVAVTRRIEQATGLDALTKQDFSDGEARIIKDMAADLMRIMTVASFLIGLVVVGLVLHSATLSRLREIGVMKALGSSHAATARLVLAQAAWTVLPATVAAVVATWVLSVVLGVTGSNIAMALEPGSILRTTGAALLLGALGALAPLTRVLRVDPATVFRR